MQANPCMVEALVKVTVEDRLAEVGRIRLARLAARSASDAPAARGSVVRSAIWAALRRIGVDRAKAGVRPGSVTRATRRTGAL